MASTVSMRGIFVFLACFTLATPAWSHDFWLQPKRYKIAVSTPDTMTIQVGHGVDRTRWSGALERVVAFDLIDQAGRTDLRSALKPDHERDATLNFANSGTQMLVFQSNYATSNLPAIRFNTYLQAEGLTPALELRQKTGKMDAVGREIYSRCAKAIVQVGTPTTAKNSAVTRPVGLPLEIVPERDPYDLRAGEQLPVRVIYEGRPLAGALVMLTNLEFDGRALETRVTDRTGRAAFAVPHVGTWLVNVLWTKPIQGNPDADFDTTFSSLTFGY